MWKFAVTLCLLVALASSTPHPAAVDPSKSTVSILKNEKHKCLGVVVDSKYIATSANCVAGSAASSLSIMTFKTNGNSTADLFTSTQVQRVIVHPYYTPPSLDYDIALLKLKSPITTPVSLQLGKAEPLPNDNVQTMFWDPQDEVPTLQPERVQIEDRKSCRNKVGKFVSGRMICAYVTNPPNKMDGPLILDDKLVGIPSKRIDSNQGALPAIYTNIANSEIYSFLESYV